jgi:fucose permease
MTRFPSGEFRERGPDLLLYLIFAATGVAVVLPGNLLPTLLVRWRISDQHAGLFFLLFFATSTSGAVLSRGPLTRSIARGCILVALGLGSLAFASGTTAFLSFAVYGLGLGIAMTSVSLRQSRRHPARRTAEMTRLNLIWAVGACCGPFLVLHGVATVGVKSLLFGVAASFALAGLLALWLVPPAPAVPRAEQGPAPFVRTPMTLLLLVPLATGIEAGTSGWLTTYANRSGDTLGITISTVTCFWIGMLVSRGVLSLESIAAAAARFVLTICPAIVIAGMLLVLHSPAGACGLCGSLLIGAGAGPMYPLLIARCLSYSEAGNLVFVLGGTGAAFFPWIAGVISTMSGSLRLGLSSLLLAAVTMQLMGLRQALAARRQ